MKRTLLILTLTVLLPVISAAQGTAFSFQGRLNDGMNTANGAYDLRFELFTALTGGAQVGTTVDRPNTALVNGVFSVMLDFGATAFDNPNTVFIEIAVKPNGSPNAFTVLGPRQQLTVVPLAARANDSAKLGGVPAGEFVTSTSNSFIKNSTTVQTADFNVYGDGLVGRRLGVGFGAFSDPGIAFDVIGSSRFRSSSGGSVDIGTPNGETGIAITRGLGRGDIRFSGAAMRLVAGSAASGPPADANGITIATQGNVGVGAAPPLDSKLYVNGKLDVNGPITQPHTRRGLPKALILVTRINNGPPYIADCYNGVTGESYVASPLSTCGFTVRDANPASNIAAIITFPFSLSEPRAILSLANTGETGSFAFLIENNGMDLLVGGRYGFDLIVY